jgi:epoxyqueuosine reductase
MADERRKMSRRDALRVAGVGGGALAVAGTVGARSAEASAAGRRFSDPAGRPRRPWWVKTVEVPTVEVDWSKTERFNERSDPATGKGTVRGAGLGARIGVERAKEIVKAGQEKARQDALNHVPGRSLRDIALWGAHSTRPPQTFLGNQKIVRPEDRGIPRWTGTPEEAAKMLRVVMRHLGAATVGFVALDQNTRKLIYSVDPDGKQLVFVDDETPQETETERHIPNSYGWVMVWTMRMSEETFKRAPSPIAAQTTHMIYAQNSLLQNQIQDFLRGIGYQGLGEASFNALGVAPAFAVLAGLGELSRLNRLITPEFGPMVRVYKMILNLPVAVDKPIDAGIMEFCKHCKKCAESCPVGALSFDDEPSWQVRGTWNNPGHKAYFDDGVKCMSHWRALATNCGICFAACPFAKKDRAWIHEMVKAGIAKAPQLDGLFRRMDDAFGYGVEKDQELWWDLDLPEFGRDSTAPVKGR